MLEEICFDGTVGGLLAALTGLVDDSPYMKDALVGSCDKPGETARVLSATHALSRTLRSVKFLAEGEMTFPK